MTYITVVRKIAEGKYYGDLYDNGSPYRLASLIGTSRENAAENILRIKRMFEMIDSGDIPWGVKREAVEKRIKLGALRSLW